nr:hypothetical protein ZK228.2 - Caenorhabditis elegans [Caenorhabditis elegans]
MASLNNGPIYPDRSDHPSPGQDARIPTSTATERVTAGRTKKRTTSLAIRLVGPLKRRINQKIEIAKRVLAESEAKMKIFPTMPPHHLISDEDATYLDALLIRLQTVLGALEGMRDFIDDKFGDPEMAENPNQQAYYQEVIELLEKSKASSFANQLRREIEVLRMEMRVRNIPISSFDVSTLEATDAEAGAVTDEDEADAEMEMVESTVEDQAHRSSGLHRTVTNLRTLHGASNSPAGTPLSNRSGLSWDDGAMTLHDELRYSYMMGRVESQVDQSTPASNRGNGTRASTEQQQLHGTSSTLQGVVQGKREQIEQGPRDTPILRNDVPTTKGPGTLTTTEYAGPVLPTRRDRDLTMIHASAGTHTESIFHPTPGEAPLQAQVGDPLSRQMVSALEKIIQGQNHLQSEVHSCRDLMNGLTERVGELEAPKIVSKIKNNQKIVDDSQSDQSSDEDEGLPPKTRRNIRYVEVKKSSSLETEGILKYLDKFDGSTNLKTYLTDFNESVMKNRNLKPTNKFMILKTHLLGKARDCISNSSVPAEAIEKTIGSLNSIYGKDENKTSLLAKIHVVGFSQSDVKEMRRAVVRHSNLADQLTLTGIAENDERTFTPLTSRLPQAIRTRVTQYWGQKGENATFHEIFDFVNKCIDDIARESVLALKHLPYTGQNETSGHGIELPYEVTLNVAEAYQDLGNLKKSKYLADSPVYKPADHPDKYYDTSSGELLEGWYAPGKGPIMNLLPKTFPIQGEIPKNPCRACGERHSSIRCTLSSKAFRQALRDAKLCPICTGTHGIVKCKCKLVCVLCQGMHHTGGCTKREYYRDMNNYPDDAPPVQQFFELAGKAGNREPTSNRQAWAGTGTTPSYPVPQVALQPPSQISCPISLPTPPAHSPDSNTFLTFLPTTDPQQVPTKPDVEQFAAAISRAKPAYQLAAIAEKSVRDHGLSFLCLRTKENDCIPTLVDSGASISLLAHDCAEKLKMKILATTKVYLSGFNGATTQMSHVFKLQLRKRASQSKLTLMLAGIEHMPKSPYKAPVFSEEDRTYMENNNINHSEITSTAKLDGRRIDMVLGNDLLAWLNANQDTKKHILPSGRLVEITDLGYIVHPVPNYTVYQNQLTYMDIRNDGTLMHVTTLLDHQAPEDWNSALTLQVEQQWRLENIGIEEPSSPDSSKKSSAKDLQASFENTLRYNSDGILEVAFPLNGNEVRLKDNYGVALRRLHATLNALNSSKDPTLLAQYHQIFKTQEETGIIEPVTQTMKDMSKYSFMLPHRPVIKESSNTTKVRVVYDASSHAAGQLSLNDVVHAGANMVTPLFGILLRSRFIRFMIVGDLEKAFHQIHVQPEFRNLTQFLWLKDIDKPVTMDNICVKRFVRLPFGMSCSPNLLGSAIVHFLAQNPDELNADILDNLYVDNILIGVDDPALIMNRITRLKEIFNKMKMNIRELEAIDPKDRAPDTKIKFLGYKWDSCPTTDTYIIKIADVDLFHPTKRDVASKMAETFDPLGQVSPIQVPMKRLIKKLWSNDVNWKDLIPEHLIGDWRAIQAAFNSPTVTVPRRLTTDFNYKEIQLLVFSDASQDIYAAAVYAHFSYEGLPPVTTLLTSKNKIKPSKDDKWTIPKLELLGIEIGSNLASTIMSELRCKVSKIRLFTDSSCALYWILSKKNTRVWVANRIDQIHLNETRMRECGIDTTIHHCPTSDNPADLATRGMSTSDLQASKLWFNGPEFLQKDPEDWPCKIEDTVTCPVEFADLVYSEMIDPSTKKLKKPLMEKAKKPSATATVLHILKLPSSFESIVPFKYTNSLRKLMLIVYRILTFISKTIPVRASDTGVLRRFNAAPNLLEKRRVARHFIIREHYQECEELGLIFPPSLKYYVASDGLYRVVKQARSPALPAEANEPILIHPKHPLAELIMRETHEINEQNNTLGQLCEPNTGFRITIRTEPSSPFQRVGLDYLGPLEYLKDDGVSLGKAYVLVYSCFVTRAVVLRVVPDGSTEKFIMALKTIFHQVGVPQMVYSDNAPTFILGGTVLNTDISSWEDRNESLTSFMVARSIHFFRITTLSPWQGGMYERIVGLVKHQMHKVCEANKFDYYTLSYVVSGAQAMVNNRPLTQHARSPDDMIAIRPCDFLNPGVMIETPPTEFTPSAQNGGPEQRVRAHLARLEESLEILWKYWSLGYLINLRASYHKNVKCSTLTPRVGQVVLVNTNLVRRHKWPLGVIVQVHESKREDEIRTAVVRCKGKLYKRSVCQLIPLEVASSDDDSFPENTNQGDDKERVTDARKIVQHPSTTSLPKPAAALFDPRNAHYSPELFPRSTLPNLAETSENTDDLNTQNLNIPTIPNPNSIPKKRLEGLETIGEETIFSKTST